VNLELGKKSNEILVLRKENDLKEMDLKRKNAILWLFIVVFAFSLAFSGLVFSRFRQNEAANKVLKELNNKIINQNHTLEKINSELEEANREKVKIMSIIAHELRNPIFWFQNLVEVLSEKYESMPPEYIRKSLSVLDESAKNAFHLMDNLLHWSRSRLNSVNPKIGPHSLERLVTESIKMYQTIIQQKEIKLLVNVSDKFMANVDPDLFACVVRNLISNAIKYTPYHGNIEINCKEQSTEIVICISDTGIGIREKDMENLFHPDLNLSVSGLMNEKGSGFGLKLCKEFTELNGGKIWVSSQTGSGTSFEFTVPKI